MSLAASCPRCSSPVVEDGRGWRCPDHEGIVPLWRPAQPDYELLAEHFQLCGSLPTLLPWPLWPGWSVTDFGCVGEQGRDARASLTSCVGPSELDGVVELTIVSEEPGVGLGSQCAGTDHSDPGAEIGAGPPHAKVRISGHPIALWSVPTSAGDHRFERSVFAGEALGRWLWLVLRPASAALMLNDEWNLLDINQLGPELIDLPFGGNPPPW